MKQGSHVVITEKVNRCLVEIPAGETGEVIDVDPENGDVVILLDTTFADLSHTGNTIWSPAEQVSVFERATSPALE
jgi:hypothetical protein